jgi:tRNA G37 N-methylase Trm5
MKVKSNFGINFLVENDLEEYRVENLKEKEPETIKWIDDFQLGSTFLDIGANIGQYSLYAGVKRSCKVYSFEPYYKNYIKLIENIKANSCESSISPILCALSSNQQLSNFYII